MARLVRVVQGEWTKSQRGVWTFLENPANMPDAILLRELETVYNLQTIVQSLFNISSATPFRITFQLPEWMLEQGGETGPPCNIRSTSDVQLLMSVHSWNTDPKICVVIGSEDVAKYEFICRAPFNIGSYSFLPRGITEEHHLNSIGELIRGQEILCSTEVLHEILDENMMMLLYRFSFQIQKAKNSLDLNVGAPDENGDHVVPTFSNPNGNFFLGGAANQNGGTLGFGRGHPSGHQPQQFEMNRNGFVNYNGWGGVFMPSMHHPYYNTPWTGEEMRTTYWDNLMNSRYALELQRMYGVAGSENIGYQPSDLNIGTVNSPYEHPLNLLSDDSSRASSEQGNNADVGPIQPSLAHILNPCPFTDVPSTQGESSAMGAEKKLENDGQGCTARAERINAAVGSRSIDGSAGGNEIKTELNATNAEQNSLGTSDLPEEKK